MEIQKHEHFLPLHKTTNQDTQTWPADPTSRELEKRLGIQTIQTAHRENPPHRTATQRLQRRKNTQDLIHNLNDTPLLPHHSLASLDITNLDSNIPVTETKIILTDMLKHALVTPQTQQEIWCVVDRAS